MSTIDKHIILIMVLALVLVNIAFGQYSQEPHFTGFYQVLEEGSDEQAAQVGQEIFEQIEQKYLSDSGFGALKSKMTAAEFLANQMVAQLKKATGMQMFAVSGELFDDKTRNKNSGSLSILPAKSFYETSKQIFSNRVSIEGLNEDEKKFLARFYDLKLRIFTSAIAKAGQALAIAEPSFRGTYDYVLVLPLLHASETQPVNIDVLPKWMRKSSQLDVFSDSCLLHYGFAYHAQAFARAAAELEQKQFSQESFYRAASKKCSKHLAHVAVDCLKRAIGSLAEEKFDEKIGLKFDIVQTWLDSENFTLAANEAKKIANSFPEHKKCGDAIWLYFYSLSKANNVETILSNIDTAISDSRCCDYSAKLMYMKWWALRKQKNQTAQIAALEHQLITEYSDDVMVAPIMLSRAVDLLAGQDYSGAFALLNQVQEKFPFTAAARHAKKIVEKLKNIQGSK